GDLTVSSDHLVLSSVERGPLLDPLLEGHDFERGIGLQPADLALLDHRRAGLDSLPATPALLPDALVLLAALVPVGVGHEGVVALAAPGAHPIGRHGGRAGRAAPRLR